MVWFGGILGWGYLLMGSRTRTFWKCALRLQGCQAAVNDDWRTLSLI